MVDASHQPARASLRILATCSGASPAALPLVGLVRAYQLVISPLLPPSCRFYPSCSAYAIGALERHGASTRVLSAIAVQEVAEPYIRRRAVRHLEKGRVVVFAAGTGNPYFTTDTTAVLRAAEIGAQAVLKATDVDGVYSADPKKDPKATRYAKISFDDAIGQNLGIMDATAFALCRDQKLPIKVFSIFKNGALKRVVMGEDEGTLVYC